jgi:hypothetical protein
VAPGIARNTTSPALGSADLIGCECDKIDFMGYLPIVRRMSATASRSA